MTTNDRLVSDERHEPPADVEEFRDFGTEEVFDDMRCWQEDRHLARSIARVNPGLGRADSVTELCIFCNIALYSWKEPDGRA